MGPTHHSHTPGGAGSVLPQHPTTPSMNIAGASGSSGNASNSAMSAGWNLGAQRKDRKVWTTIRERVDADVMELKLTSVELEDILKQLLSVTLPNPRIRGEVRIALCHHTVLSVGVFMWRLTLVCVCLLMRMSRRSLV